MPSTTRKSPGSDNKPSRTKRATSAQTTRKKPVARDDPFGDLVVRSKETVERSVTRLERELEKRRHITLPMIDATVTLPPPERATFYAGLGALAAFELIEWPVAVVVGLGHYLATRSRSAAEKELGEAAESA